MKVDVSTIIDEGNPESLAKYKGDILGAQICDKFARIDFKNEKSSASSHAAPAPDRPS